MNDNQKDKKQLLQELSALRSRVALLQNIALEYQKAQEALAGSEARYRAIVEGQTELICRFLPDGTLTFVNDAYCRYFGMTREELVGSIFFTLIPEQDREEVKAQLASAARLPRDNTGGRIYEHRVLGPGGEVLWQQWSDQAIFDDSGTLIEFQSVGRDITELKRTEEALRKSEELFREFAENIHEVFWIRTPHEMLYVSPAYEEVWGMSRESLYSKQDSFLESIHPEDKERVHLAYQFEQAQGYFDDQYRIIRPDGRVRWIQSRSFPVVEDGKMVRLVGIAEDITERKQAEELLRIERDLALVLDSTKRLNEAMRLLLERILQVEGLDSGAIYVVDRDAFELQLICHRGLSAPIIEKSVHLESDSPLARIALTGEPVYLSGSAPVSLSDTLPVQEVIKAMGIIPVKLDGEVVAVLSLSSHSQVEIAADTRDNLNIIAARLARIVSRVRMAEALKSKSAHLEEVNAALKVLLGQREQDKTELEECLIATIKNLALPYLEKLKKSRLTDEQRFDLEALEAHLRGVTSPFSRKLSHELIGLTPTEVRVSDLIRQGKTSKEIADILGTSLKAVLFHRQNIRKKLHLKRKKINLQTHLASIS
jgi:PAS domain S-box-containing protein